MTTVTPEAAAAESINLQLLLAASKHIGSEPEIDEGPKLVDQNGSSIHAPHGAAGVHGPAMVLVSGPLARFDQGVQGTLSIPVNQNSPEGLGQADSMEPQNVEAWLEKRKKQQSQAQRRYRNRQKLKHMEHRHTLDRLRAIAAQYHITVHDPDALDDDDGIPEGSEAASDSDLPLGSSPMTATTLPGGVLAQAASCSAGHGDIAAVGMVHSWSITHPPQLSLTPQAIAQRKYRANLKMKRSRLQRQVDLYTRVLKAQLPVGDHVLLTGAYVPSDSPASVPETPMPASHSALTGPAPVPVSTPVFHDISATPPNMLPMPASLPLAVPHILDVKPPPSPDHVAHRVLPSHEVGIESEPSTARPSAASASPIRSPGLNLRLDRDI